MLGLTLLVLLTLVAHQLVLHPLSWALQPLLQASWGLWALALLALWMFAGSRRSP